MVELPAPDREVRERGRRRGCSPAQARRRRPGARGLPRRPAGRLGPRRARRCCSGCSTRPRRSRAPPTAALAREVLEGRRPPAPRAAAAGVPHSSGVVAPTARRRHAAGRRWCGTGPTLADRLIEESALMAIKGSLKEASLPDVLQLLPGAEDRLPGAGRPAELRLRSTSTRAGSATPPSSTGATGSATSWSQNGRITPGAAGAGDRRCRSDEREQQAGRDPGRAWARSTRHDLEELHAAPDRGGGLLPVHLDPGDLQLRGRRAARARGLPRPDQSRVAAARGRAAGGRVEPHREEDPVVRPDLRGRSGRTSTTSAPSSHRAAAAHPAAARRARATCSR